MKRALVAVLFGCLTLGFASLAIAADNDQAGIALHVGPVVSKLPCDNAPALTAATIQSAAAGANTDSYTVYVLVCNGSDSTGVSGAEFGIDYNGNPSAGVDADGWTACGDLEFPNSNWPDANTGNIVTFNPGSNCQNTPSEPFVPQTVIAILGALDVTAYTPDILSVIPRPVTGFAKVSDCNGAEDDLLDLGGSEPSHLGQAEFGLGSGYNPCGLPTPVENTTWGAIKNSGSLN